ncbi:hypothetical protein [Streptomyces griseoruber]|uniref:Uncharacterized protein n=1 Tax=Streptomyces griseoruber TaxID=1943 RepID=A0A101SSJ3_9ACTN|nr:hypothetical protein [Streptomyces griseoruber]KUN79278.1 hypothetical protein AQJ64_29880 [Streptomyces griseoruber]
MIKERTLLITVDLPQGATFQQALDQLGLSAGEVDEEYGLVALDPDRGKYVLLVAESAAARQGWSEAEGVSGPFADPKIEPFWLP